jgi:hypothetical protein
MSWRMNRLKRVGISYYSSGNPTPHLDDEKVEVGKGYRGRTPEKTGIPSSALNLSA